MVEYIAVLIYIMTRNLFQAYYFFYIFSKNTTASRTAIFTFISCMIALELGCWSYFNHYLPIPLQFGLAMLYIPFGLAAVHCSKAKCFLVVLILAHISFFYQTFALVCMAQLKLAVAPMLIATGTLFLLHAVSFPIFTDFIIKYRQYYLDSQVKGVFELANLMLILSFIGAALLYDFQSVRDWSLLLGRFGTTLPAVLFIYIIIRLLKEQELNSYLNSQGTYLQNLRKSEKAYYDYILESWQNSRRLRHDLRHMALLMKSYLTDKKYEELRTVLEEVRDESALP